MKKIFTLLCVTLSSLAAMANGVEVDGIYYVLDSTNYTASVTFTGSTKSSSNNYSGNVVIPKTVVYDEQSYTVTNIGIAAFHSCPDLISISIPNSVTSISGDAFDHCTRLTSLTIPNSVTKINVSIFTTCPNLASLAVEKGNPKYDSRDNCNAVIETATNTLVTGCKNTIIPNSVTKIGGYAFESCHNLTSITLGKSVTSIASRAFYSCRGLTSITCWAIKPPSLGSTDVFYNVPRDIPLYVPASSIPAYQAAAQWNEFDLHWLKIDLPTPDTAQLSWLPVDSASLYKLRIYSEQIELDTTLLIEADSLNGGISIPVTLAPNRVRRMPMDDIGSVVVITLEPNSGATKDTPFRVTVSTTSKDKIDILFDMEVYKGNKFINEESGSFTLNAPLPDGLEDTSVPCFGVSSGIFDLYGRHYPLRQWNQLPAGIYILRDGGKASKVMKR